MLPRGGFGVPIFSFILKSQQRNVPESRLYSTAGLHLISSREHILRHRERFCMPVAFFQAANSALGTTMTYLPRYTLIDVFRPGLGRCLPTTEVMKQLTNHYCPSHSRWDVPSRKANPTLRSVGPVNLPAEHMEFIHRRSEDNDGFHFSTAHQRHGWSVLPLRKTHPYPRTPTVPSPPHSSTTRPTQITNTRILHCVRE